MTIDLYVGGSPAEPVLRAAPPMLVNRVVCRDDRIAALARDLGFAVWRRDPHNRALAPAIAAIALHFPQILRPELIHRYDGAIWGLHPGLLPWGRGTHPVFWALWEGTPAGATLHELTARVGSGPIVEQIEVPVGDDDTGGSLRVRVQAAEREVFIRWLPRLAFGERPLATPQPRGGSHHTRGEFEFLRDEGRYEVPRADRARLARCLTFGDSHVAASR